MTKLRVYICYVYKQHLPTLAALQWIRKWCTWQQGRSQSRWRFEDDTLKLFEKWRKRKPCYIPKTQKKLEKLWIQAGIVTSSSIQTPYLLVLTGWNKKALYIFFMDSSQLPAPRLQILPTTRQKIVAPGLRTQSSPVRHRIREWLKPQLMPRLQPLKTP